MNCAIEPLLLPISGLERAYIKLINVRRLKSEVVLWRNYLELLFEFL